MERTTGILLTIITFLSWPIINTQSQPQLHTPVPFRGLDDDIRVDYWESNIVSSTYSYVINDQFGEKSTHHSKYTVDNLIHIIPEQTGLDNDPPGWLLPTLLGIDAKVTLSIRSDNWYWTAFENWKGVWYSFKGLESLVPGSIPLDIECSYGKDGFGEFEDLTNLRLNRNQVLKAINTLYLYDPVYTAKQDLQEAMGILLLTIIEPSRFKPLFKEVDSGWDSEEGVYLTKIDILRCWARFCCELLRGWRTDRPDFPKKLEEILTLYRITNKKDAIENFFGSGVRENVPGRATGRCL